MFKRPLFDILQIRIQEPRRFIQVMAGPRQAGKTTLARQLEASELLPCHYASADQPTLRDRTWIEQQWDLARLKADKEGALLILDEIQKIPAWSETVKSLWDQDTHGKVPLRVILLGSAPLLVQEGLTESLAGRFELIRVPHWSFSEMQQAFGWDLDEYLFFGGYPGAATLISDQERWARYILDSLVETTISRDVLLMSRINKPALLRQLFHLGCAYSGQILSYQKMLGQLQDAGNTTTLAHYLQLLSGAGLLAGLPKYSGHRVRQRASSPKLLVLNTALMTAASSLSFEEARADRRFWGRLVESAAGAHLVNSAWGRQIEVFYWRERSKEVDFVLKQRESLTAIEVKTARRREELPGMAAFDDAFSPHGKLLVGGQGMALDDFFKTSAQALIRPD